MVDLGRTTQAISAGLRRAQLAGETITFDAGFEEV
jgi:hypothetical protein